MCKSIKQIKKQIVKQLQAQAKAMRYLCRNPNISRKTLMLLTTLEHWCQTHARPLGFPAKNNAHAQQAQILISEIIKNDAQAIQRIDRELSLLNDQHPENTHHDFLLFWDKPLTSYKKILSRLRENLINERPLIPALLSIELLKSELPHYDVDAQTMHQLKVIEQKLKQCDRSKIGSKASLNYAEKLVALLQSFVVPVAALKSLPTAIIRCVDSHQKMSQQLYDLNNFAATYPLYESTTQGSILH